MIWGGELRRKTARLVAFLLCEAYGETRPRRTRVAAAMVVSERLLLALKSARHLAEAH